MHMVLVCKQSCASLATPGNVRWQQWVPPSTRRKHCALPESYAIGDEKIFFSNGASTVTVCRFYLQCLVKAEDSQRQSLNELVDAA